MPDTGTSLTTSPNLVAGRPSHSHDGVTQDSYLGPGATGDAAEKHGSESYFVLGEGVLTEGIGGRERTLAAADDYQVPPFRFSRIGPKGAQRQLGEANRKRIGNAKTAGGGGPSQISAGVTYLGRFIDHDLTFDKINIMLGQSVSPADAAVLLHGGEGWRS